jgi:hypothetical protein
VIQIKSQDIGVFCKIYVTCREQDTVQMLNVKGVKFDISLILILKYIEVSCRGHVFIILSYWYTYS